MSRLHRSSARAFKALIAGSAAALLMGMGAWACVGEGELESFACPNKDVFVQHVSPYLERRCGTLDCHGQPKRPMRIYGQLGLRHPLEDNFSGGAATTTLELDANFDAVCNLDPEAMAESAETLGASADKLLLVNKMRGIERHKGGQAVIAQTPGDRCVLNWLKFKPSEVVGPDCTAAVDQLK